MAIPATVEEYVGAMPPEAVEPFQTVRRLIHEVAPGVTESIRYQMPVFATDAGYITYVGAWKKHLGLYPIPRIEALEGRLAPHRTAKDTVRFFYEDPLPTELVRDLLAELVRRLHTAQHD